MKQRRLLYRVNSAMLVLSFLATHVGSIGLVLHGYCHKQRIAWHQIPDRWAHLALPQGPPCPAQNSQGHGLGVGLCGSTCFMQSNRIQGVRMAEAQRSRTSLHTLLLSRCNSLLSILYCMHAGFLASICWQGCC